MNEYESEHVVTITLEADISASNYTGRYYIVPNITNRKRLDGQTRVAPPPTLTIT